MAAKTPDITTSTKSDGKKTVQTTQAPDQKQSASRMFSSMTPEHMAGATASVYNSSNCEIDCDPCTTDGDHVMAVGYCTYCNEYYCQSCYREHSRSKATKDHKILDQVSMPTIHVTPPPVSIASLNINKGSDDADDSQHQDDYIFKRDINIKYPNEKKECLITGMTTISDSELVIIDNDNQSLKMIDIVNDQMTGFIQFDTRPFSITAIPNREVAVTFPNEQLIRILTTTGGLAVKKSFKTNGVCLAIEYCNEKLYVSFSKPVKFQILSLTGGLRKTIKPDVQFLEQCICPRHIAVHSTESKMYVTDWRNNVIVCMNIDGVLLHVYKDDELESPDDISFSPSCSLYICNRKQHILYRLPDDLSEASIILASRDGLKYPCAMCFCPVRKTIYVSSAVGDTKIRNVIKEFKHI